MNGASQAQSKSKKILARRQAVATLALQGTPQAIQQLLVTLADPEPEIRAMVLRALNPFRSPDVTNAQIAALADPDPQVREAALVGITQSGDPTAVPSLVPLLEDREPAVRKRAAKALESFGLRPTDVVVPNVQPATVPIGAPPVKLNLSPFERLVLTLKDQKNPDRGRAVEELVQLGDAAAIQPLIEALKDSDLSLRVAVIEALSQLGDGNCVESLVPMLRDADPVVRTAAAAAIGRLNSGRVVETLAPLLSDSNSGVRKVVAETLGNLGDPTAVEPLVRSLSAPEHDLREAVVEALGRLGQRAAIEHLVLALVDSQSSVRNAAGRVLRQIDRDWPASPEAHRAIPALRTALASQDYWVRHCAGDTLRRLMETSQTAGGTTLFVDPARRRQSLTLQALLKTLSDSDRDLRLIAAEALSRLGDVRAREALTAAASDLDEWVASAARAAIGRLGGEPQIPASVVPGDARSGGMRLSSLAEMRKTKP